MASHNEHGKKGEELAVTHLANKNYRILERNWYWEKAEIDIIAQKDGYIVFAEVKTRNSDYFGEPYEAVSKKKQRLITKAANAYILEKELDLEARFDIVSVLLNSNACKIEHLEDAFYPLA